MWAVGGKTVVSPKVAPTRQLSTEVGERQNKIRRMTIAGKS
jgi:hypothetical protein